MVATDDIIIPPQTGWLADPAAQQVCALLETAGHRAFFVGGCVRNALLGLAGSDVDICTDARPERVMELAQQASFRAIPTGLAHGTITVVVEDTPFEITTFRRDIETDGRRAVVAFSDNIEDDARRRDFTMNALYATAEGRVLDPLGGLPDLVARHVRFIENPDARIQEDCLRSLRFFRFYALYGDPDMGPDSDALSAIAKNLDGLSSLSRERIGHEMRKLLAAPDPAPALAGMRNTGVLSTILPGADDRWIAPIVHYEQELDVAADWLLRLVALGGAYVTDALRLSKAEARQYDILQDMCFGALSLEEVAYRHGLRPAQSALMLRAAVAEQPVDPATLPSLIAASKAVFPITARDVMPDKQGAELGKQLAELEDRWVASGFTLTRSDLLNLR